MYIVQLFLPLKNNEQRPFAPAAFDLVRNELTEQFGGVTAFRRAPAEGMWQDPHGAVSRDEMVILEVMTEQLDRAWWTRYKQELTARFQQEELIIRATAMESL